MIKIDILLATYNPNLNYLKEQLISLNNQDFPNVELIVVDDCSDLEKYKQIGNLLEHHIQNFKYSLYRNELNLGSNKTFELLVNKSNSNYVAFCDQDDIWNEDKLTRLLNIIEHDNSTLVYSDLSIIDSFGNLIHDSLKKQSRRIKHVYGKNRSSSFVLRNSVTGCSMIMKSEIAKEAIPFPEKELYVHDHWLALTASLKGEISYTPVPTVKYRIHENNQVGDSLLSGINNSNDYLVKKMNINLGRLEFLKKYVERLGTNKKFIEYWEKHCETRLNYQKTGGFVNFAKMLKIFNKDPMVIGFEILLPWIPTQMQESFFKKVKN
ncbi:glycosyltransferase family 2 protein [Alkalihalobacillus sp. FSL W8-0930]